MECLAHYFHSHKPNAKTPHDFGTKLHLVSEGQDILPSMNGITKKMAQRVLPQGQAPHVCIVGAGVSGLRCASVLSGRGVRVTILEGRHRIGGRVHQSSQLGRIVDLGPNWIHGTVDNPILDLAKQTKGTTFSPPEDATPAVYDTEGRPLNQNIANELSEIVWGLIADGFKYSSKNCASIPPEKSLMDYLKERVKANDLNEQSLKLVLLMARMWGDFVGEPIEKQSLKYFWLEECIEGENLFLASTYKDVLNQISTEALAKSELHLSTKVTTFTPKNPSSQGSLVTVTTTENITHVFDEVILTCPLGWLKRNLSAFSPGLPLRIIEAIQHISYGRLEKVYLTFPTAFWVSESSNPFFAQFLSPTYTDENPENWTIECVNLAMLPGTCAQPTLLFYINGPCAKHVTSLVSGLEPGTDEYKANLDHFFKPYYSLLPNYSASSCVPTNILATDWQNDEFAGWGSYTTFQTSNASEDVQLDKDIEALREGCPDVGIWFAGEHTAPFVALGTVTGAYWSGQAVGKRVAEVYGL